MDKHWSPFKDPLLDRSYRIGCVRRMYEDAVRMQHSGVWISVEEINAVLSVIPRTEIVLTPLQTEAARNALQITNT